MIWSRTILVRPRAWWFNKVPLSIFLILLLVSGTGLTPVACWAILATVGTVCCAANYGYALNEMFDIEEDRRGGRLNAASDVPTGTMWAIALLSGIGALAIATAAGGILGLALTGVELMLPLAYSVPPIRVKERGWLGIFSDALAAHLYPAMLALVIAEHLALHFSDTALIATIATWSLATGLRGIISHQLQSAEHDQISGLSTMVHRIGHRELASLVVFFILPIEVVCFTAVIIQSGSAVVIAIWSIYVAYECLKFALNVFPIIVFTRRGQGYLPFVDEGFYKVWGPLAAIIAAGITDPVYLSLLPAYVVLFRPRVQWEWGQVRTTAEAAYKRFVSAALTR